MLLITALNRFQASGLHLLASACIATLAAATVFLLWYPDVLAYASGVGEIFLLLIVVDVVLGPVITLIIFNTKKKELKRDLGVIVVVQLLALFYGVHTVFIARPVYLVFNADRFDLVYANEISEENMSRAAEVEYQSLPLLGPKTIAASLPHDPVIAKQIMHAAVTGGEDVQHMPQYYLPYADQSEELLKQIRPLDKLRLSNLDRGEEVDALIENYRADRNDLGYIPLFAKRKNVVVIVSRKTGEVLRMSDLRP